MTRKHSTCTCARSNELVRGLDSVRNTGANLGHDLTVPDELVHHYVDSGKSPDDFTGELHARVARSSAAAKAKQHAFRQVEEAIRSQAGDLLSDQVKT